MLSLPHLEDNLLLFDGYRKPLLRLWARHLHLEIYIARSSHKASISRSAQNGMICALEIHYLKRQLLLAEILLIAENHIESDLAE